MKTIVGPDRPPRLLTLKNNSGERRMKGKLIYWIRKRSLLDKMDAF